MATCKAVSSKAGIGSAINYVTKDEKTEAKLVSGIGCCPETAEVEMQATKELWGKTDGRTYKHFTQSFHKDDKVTPEQAHQIACDLARDIPAWNGHEILIATHVDKSHIHSHFIVNSVNFENGYKLQWSKEDLADMKLKSDELCQAHGLHICEKGKTFEGVDRTEASTYTKEAHQAVKSDDSYIVRIKEAVLEAKSEALSRGEFCDRMMIAGIRVDWSENRKNVLFVDMDREQAGEQKCKIRLSTLSKTFNLDLDKKTLEKAFEDNFRAFEGQFKDDLQLAPEKPADVGSVAKKQTVFEKTPSEKKIDRIEILKQQYTDQLALYSAFAQQKKECSLFDFSGKRKLDEKMVECSSRMRKMEKEFRELDVEYPDRADAKIQELKANIPQERIQMAERQEKDKPLTMTMEEVMKQIEEKKTVAPIRRTNQPQPKKDRTKEQGIER